MLTELLNYHNFSEVEVTAVVRSQEKAEKLKQLGINVVVGSLTDQKLMEKLAEETDLVLAMVKSSISLLCWRYLISMRRPMQMLWNRLGFYYQD